MAFYTDRATRSKATQGWTEVWAILLVALISPMPMVSDMNPASEHYTIAYSYSGVRSNVH